MGRGEVEEGVCDDGRDGVIARVGGGGAAVAVAVVAGGRGFGEEGEGFVED